MPYIKLHLGLCLKNELPIAGSSLQRILPMLLRIGLAGNIDP